MKDAENEIFKQVKDQQASRVKNKTAYITFDMEVEAKMIAISDKSVANKIEDRIKAANETPAQRQELLKGLHKELSKEKGPKFVKSIKYLVYSINEKDNQGKSLKTEGISIKASINEDVHLKEILKKL